MTPTGEIREDTGDGAAVALTTPDRGGTPTAPVAGPGSAGGSRRRTWALLAFDSRTGCATAVVAFAGIEYPGGPAAVSWVPLVGSADQGWRERLTAHSARGLGGLLERAATDVGGVSADVTELDPPAAHDIEGAVEQLMDDFLAVAA
jgi:hypothetical protein